MQLQPHDPSLLLTKKLNTSYDPGKGTGRWGTFMEEVLPNPQVRGYLQRALGYALTGEANQRAIFLLHGNSGTGKSQVVEAMAKVFGDFASGISAGALLPKRQAGPGDDVHKLRGTRMACVWGLNENAVRKESLIKSATGGDTLTTRALDGDFVSWRPEFVIFMATNYLPRVSSTDDAIWRRVKPIKFEQCFVDDDGSPLHADGADKGVRIATEDPECVLNWLLEGLAAYRERGLGAPAEVQAWTQDYRDEVDTVRQFITEGQVEGRLKLEDKLETGSRDLYKAYVAWCADAQQHPVSLRHFGQLMESSKFERVRQGRGVMWQGIGLLGFMVEAQTPAVRSGWTSPMRM
jgi:putative DNA primase/helicase